MIKDLRTSSINFFEKEKYIPKAGDEIDLEEVQ
jgi:hypothetical protein